MDEEGKERFLQAVKVGDIVLIEYEDGVFKKKQKTSAGHVVYLDKTQVQLSTKNTLEDLGLFEIGDFISYKSITSYCKLGKQQ